MSTAPPKSRLLVADDDRDVLEALRLLLKSEGYDVEVVTSPSGVAAAVGARDFDALLMDMNYARDTTGGTEGLDLLTRLQQLDATLPVVVMTAWGSIEGAVEALHRGARDYIEKPFNNTRLLHVLRTQVELGRALRRSQRLESENLALRRDGAPQLIAESAVMQPILRLMERIGPSDANALITGEHGTGKEVVAAWLHAASPRAARAMVTVNLGGLSEGVFESELFGHTKGAFTDAKTDRVGKRALRPHQGRVHRREDGPRRTLRARGRRHALPRRDREPLAGAAGEAPSRAAGRRVRTRGFLALAPRGRAHPRGDQRRRARGGRRGEVPRGSFLPPEHRGDPPAAAARAARRHSAARRSFPQTVRGALSPPGHGVFTRRHARAPRVFLARQRARARARDRTCDAARRG